MNRIAVAALLIPPAFMCAMLLLPARTPSVVPSDTLSPPSALRPPSSPAISGTARVIDGDTIEVSGTRVRLQGIDAPEGAQTCQRDSGSYLCGRLSTRALSDFANGKPVRCEQSGTDQFKRVLATCFLNATGVDIGQWMVSQGYAFAFVRYSIRYVPDQRAAAEAKRGLWVGSFELPWEYRARLRSGATP